MSRRPARVTQADVARAIRAARQAGACGVEVRPDGQIIILLAPPAPQPPEPSPAPLEPEREIVL